VKLLVDIDLPGGGHDIGRLIDNTVREDADRFVRRLAPVVQTSLRKKSGGIWPRRTGYSGDRFTVTPRDGGLVVDNSADYAGYVNNNPTYKSGARNPNFHAVQRTIQQEFDAMSSAALKG